MNPNQAPVLEEVTGKPCPEYLAVQAITYNDGQPWADDGPLQGRRSFQLALGETVIGGLAGFEFNIHCREGLKSCVGFSMVSVLPEFRRSGFGQSMMTQAIQTFAAEGKALGALYGFSEQYYRQLGFETCGGLHDITCDVSLLPDVKMELEPRRLEDNSWTEIKPVYEEFAKQRSGYCERPEIFWKRKFMGGGRHAFVFGEPAEAYIIVNLKTAFYETLEIPEFIWTTRGGCQSALSFFKKLAINKSSVTWKEPNDGPFSSNFIHTGGRTAIKIGPVVMHRIFDLRSALEGCPAPKGFDLSLKVLDSDIEKNHGAWRLFESAGELVVEQGKNPEIELPIGLLTQILLGQPSADSLIRNGILPNSPAASRLAALFPGQTVGCCDFY